MEQKIKNTQIVKPVVKIFIITILFFYSSCYGSGKLQPSYTGATESPDYSVEVNGKPVFVVNHKDYRTADSRMGYAQFTMTEKVTVKITYKKGAINTCQISPLEFGIQPKIAGNTATFELDKPRYLMAFINKGNQPNFMCDGLILFAESPVEKPANPGDKNVVNIMDYGIDNTGKTVETDKINKAITDASQKPGGGIVFFPKGGIYRTGAITMKSNVHLYLDEGALIQASDEPADYKNVPHGKGMLTCGFVTFVNVENAGILGRGTIDMNGYPELNSKKNIPGFASLYFYQCKNIKLSDFIIKRSLTWTIHQVDCENFHSKNVKIINRKTRYWEDIYDIDISRHVLIENGFALSMDDMWAIKGTVKGNLKTNEDITIRGFLVYGFDSGLAIGYANEELWYTLAKDVTLEDIHFVSTMVDWGVFISYELGVGEAWEPMDTVPALENFTFKNIWFEDGGTFLIATGKSKVKNFKFENIHVLNADEGYKGILRGDFVDSMSFTGFTHKGVPVTNIGELSKVGAGIDVCCPVKFIPSSGDAYLFSFEKGLDAYKIGEWEKALTLLNTSVNQNSGYGKAVFYRSIVLISIAEAKKKAKDETWKIQWELAKADMQKAEDLGFYKAKEFKEKNIMLGGWYKGPADQLRRVLFSTEGELPYTK
jgi:hypothetical protein